MSEELSNPMDNAIAEEFIQAVESLRDTLFKIDLQLKSLETLKDKMKQVTDVTF